MGYQGGGVHPYHGVVNGRGQRQRSKILKGIKFKQLPTKRTFARLEWEKTCSKFKYKYSNSIEMCKNCANYYCQNNV